MMPLFVVTPAIDTMPEKIIGTRVRLFRHVADTRSPGVLMSPPLTREENRAEHAPHRRIIRRLYVTARCQPPPCRRRRSRENIQYMSFANPVHMHVSADAPGGAARRREVYASVAMS
jgi:hypothetical protein